MRSNDPFLNNPLDDSILSTDFHHVMTRPAQPRVEPRSMIPHSINQHRSNINVAKELLTAIKVIPSLNKLELNEKFVELLVNQYAINNLILVSFWGPAGKGKSFLVDSLLSIYENAPVRMFSKAKTEGANCWVKKI